MKHWLKHIKQDLDSPRPGGVDLRFCEWSEPIPHEMFKGFTDSLTWEDFSLYPDTSILIKAIAKTHNIHESFIYLAPGSSEAIKNVFDCLQQGETVLTTDPCFHRYDISALQNNLRIQKINPQRNFSYDAGLFRNANLIVFSTPSNPIGCVFSRHDIISILESNPNSWVLVDEAYNDFVESPDCIIDLISFYPNLIISRSFSKTYGAAGCRIGYLISNAENIKIVSSMRQMNELSGASIKYALFMLENQHIADEYCKKTIAERKRLFYILRTAGISVIPSEGNWILAQPSQRFNNVLAKYKISIKDGIRIPGLTEEWVRITVGPGVSGFFEELLTN